jgi:quercetin dioxygenase-like cupin family protein
MPEGYNSTLVRNEAVIKAKELFLKIFRFSPGMPITVFDSVNATGTPVLRDVGGFYLTWIHLAAGGLLGNHEAVKNQLFVVINGAGWVQTQGSSKVAVAAGQAAFWQAGERHASGTDTGMAVIVIESETLDSFHIAGEA